jgi:hypothetical protein
MGVFRGVINAIYLVFTAKAGTSLVWSVPKGREEKIVQACAFLRVGRVLDNSSSAIQVVDDIDKTF